MLKLEQKRSGFILVFSLIVLFIMLMTALSIAAVTVTERKSSIATKNTTTSFQVADSFAEVILKEINNYSTDNISELTGNSSAVFEAGSSCAGGVISNASLPNISGDIGRIEFYKYDQASGAPVALDCADGILSAKLLKISGTFAGTTRAISVPVPICDPSSLIVSDSNTVGLWHFEEADTSVTLLEDSSGSDNDGTANGTTAAAGVCNARNFNGTSDYVEIPDNSSLQLTNNFTLAAWVFRTQNNSIISTERVLSKSSQTFQGGDYYMNINSNKLRCGVRNGLGVYFRDSQLSVPVNQWVYLACVMDGSNVITPYINGVASTTSPSGNPAPAVTRATDMQIGRAHTSTWEYNIVGRIDEVHISKIARTGAPQSSDCDNPLYQDRDLCREYLAVKSAHPEMNLP